MKKIIFLTLILTLMISACAAPTPTFTPIPNTPIPTPTGTSAPSATPTSIPTPTVEKTPAQLWAEENNGGYDADLGIAWDEDSGRVTWELGADGEWIHYPDGMVPIPPGPGFESEPPLNVPYFKDFNAAMAAVTNELPWGEIPHVYREKQNGFAGFLEKTYWRPIRKNGTWVVTFDGFVDVHNSSALTEKANVYTSNMQLPTGGIVIRLSYESEATQHYFKDILIKGNPNETHKELERIDQCVKSNQNASDLAELCKSDTIEIPAPVK